MSITTSRFTNEKAPYELFYDCGCRSIRHEYHDGNVSRNVVRHDGTVLEDELIYGQ